MKARTSSRYDSSHLVSSRLFLKQVLGELPFTAEIYWQLRQQGKPLNKSFSLRRVEKALPEWLSLVEATTQETRGTRCTGCTQPHRPHPPGRRIMIFSMLRYWVEHATLLGLAMAGLGHQVTLAYLPYANWRKPINRFDLRRQNLYTRHVLERAAPALEAISFLDIKPATIKLPPGLLEAVREVSIRDVQYTLQVEDIDLSGELYRLRLERNTQAARAALAWMQANRPDVVITPNGSILEMGVVYEVARRLDIPVVTYEFGEQRGRIWQALNAEVMHQETGALWEARKDCALTESQWEQVRALFTSRQRASLWENFSRRWQGVPTQGGAQVRNALGLGDPTQDPRPVVLLAANVIGDSLTLGRQVFSQSMTEWLERTIQYFIRQPVMHLVVRVHPGERYTKGPSVADIVRRALAEAPADASTHIHLVEAAAPVNTYDVVEIADLGLVYTTTVGMEMAMSGVPVIVSGKTHYRGKGFTLDPDTWEVYFEMLDRILQSTTNNCPSRGQVEQAWNYAYRFFFEFPNSFPWHLVHFWKDVEMWPLDQVLSEKGQKEFGVTFQYLAGEPRVWRDCE